MGKRKSSSTCSSAVGLGGASSAEAGQAAAAATAACRPLDSKPHSSAKSKAMQKLKSMGKKVLRPSCMRMPATDTVTCPQEVVQQQQQWLVPMQVSTAELKDKVKTGSGRVQLVAAPVHAPTVVEERQILPQPSSKNQRLNKLKGVFKRRRSTVIEEAKPESAMDCSTESLREPAADDFIAAMKAPSGVQPKPEMLSSSITAAGKPNVQAKRGMKQKLARLLSLSSQ